ncbi:MAG: iron(III) transport system ATP-binding protein [Parasphingorhabdus sp.]|jgi:iron(III) transport system ATP-binding protein
MISVRNLNFSYGSDDQSTAILSNINLTVQTGEMLILLGGSGSGKSTLLRLVAGHLSPNKGEITIGDTLVYDHASKINIAPNRRELGMVFQSFALWPHLTVREHLMFPLKFIHRYSAEDKNDVINSVLHRVRLAGSEFRYPHQLSGGQQQRLSLGRALARGAPHILLDEPLSNIDAGLRIELAEDIKELVQAERLTAIYVTHDQAEALRIANYVALIDNGRIIEKAQPITLYRSPKTLVGARFFGKRNELGGKVIKYFDGLATVQLDKSDVTMKVCCTEKIQLNDDVAILFLPECISIGKSDPTANKNVLAGRVLFSIFQGESWEIQLDVFGNIVRCRMDSASIPPRPTEIVELRIAPNDCRCYQFNQRAQSKGC